jgi:hypothetical protein
MKIVAPWTLAGALVLLLGLTGFRPALAYEFECNGDEAKCGNPPSCTGDETACNVLRVHQEGVDKATGAHVTIIFYVPPEHTPQSMDLTLTLGEQLSDCAAGSTREVNANADNGEGRSIDGFLCGLRTTWTRY